MLTAKSVKRIRARKGWTQEQLAGYLFVTTRTVQNWEKRGCKMKFAEQKMNEL